MTKASSIFDRILGVSLAFCCAILIFIMLSVNLEVVTRYFFNKPQIWVIEVSEILLLYITFICAAWVLKKEGHVSMDLLLNRLKPRARALANAITSIVALIVVFPLFWYGARVTWDHHVKGLYYVNNFSMPDVIIFWVIPVGSLLLVIQLLRRAYSFWEKRKGFEELGGLEKEGGVE